MTRSGRPWRALVAAVLAYGAAFALSIAFTEEALVAGARASAAGDVRAFALSRAGLLLGAAAGGAATFGVAVIAARLESGSVRARLRCQAPAATRSAWLAAPVGLVGLSFVYGSAADLAGLGGGVVDIVGRALAGPSPAQLVAALAAIALVPAIGEEALFRGFVLGGVTPALGRWPGIVASAAAFGVLHRDPVQGTGAFVAGLFLGWTTERTGALGPSIVAHAVNNATFVVLASLGVAGGLPRPVEAAALLGGAGALVAGALGVLRASRRAS